MARQIINISTIANDRNGDPIRTAFTKVNSNFEELYNNIASTSTVAKTGGAFETQTPLDLTKITQKLTDGFYSVADGVEGQVMYLVQQDGATGTATVYFANGRVGGTTYNNIFMTPFNNGQNLIVLLFTDGAWQSLGGEWD